MPRIVTFNFLKEVRTINISTKKSWPNVFINNAAWCKIDHCPRLCTISSSISQPEGSVWNDGAHYLAIFAFILLFKLLILNWRKCFLNILAIFQAYNLGNIFRKMMFYLDLDLLSSLVNVKKKKKWDCQCEYFGILVAWSCKLNALVACQFHSLNKQTELSIITFLRYVVHNKIYLYLILFAPLYCFYVCHAVTTARS